MPFPQWMRFGSENGVTWIVADSTLNGKKLGKALLTHKYKKFTNRKKNLIRGLLIDNISRCSRAHFHYSNNNNIVIINSTIFPYQIALSHWSIYVLKWPWPIKKLWHHHKYNTLKVLLMMILLVTQYIPSHLRHWKVQFYFSLPLSLPLSPSLPLSLSLSLPPSLPLSPSLSLSLSAKINQLHISKAIAST